MPTETLLDAQRALIPVRENQAAQASAQRAILNPQPPATAAPPDLTDPRGGARQRLESEHAMRARRK